MGCFNLQCGYSGLEIHEDDEVQLFLMVNNRFGDGFIGFNCYPHDCYELLGPGFPATYNDYGWYNIDETNLVAQHLQQRITNALIPLTHEQCSRDRGGKAKIMRAIRKADEANEPRPLVSWDIIGDMIHDGELFVKNSYNRPVQVYISKFAVHKHFYDQMNAKDIKQGYGDNAELLRDIIRKTVQSMRNPVDKAAIAVLDGIEYHNLTVEQKELLSAYYRGFGMDDGLHMDYIVSSYKLNKLAAFKTEDGQQLSEDELVDAYHGLVALHSAMSTMNKMYLPQGPGHQCYNFETEIEYHEEVLAYVKARHEQKLIEWGEDA